MNERDKNRIIYCICRDRWCDNCPLKKMAPDRHCSELEWQAIVSVGKDLFMNNDWYIKRALSYYKENVPLRYKTFMKYIAGVEYD